MFKKLLFVGALFTTALSTTVLPTSAFAAEPTYVVGSGGTYRPFEFENAKKELKALILILLKRSPRRRILISS